MAVYKGKQCKVVRKNGRHATVRFAATGSEMTVPAAKLNGSKRRKAKTSRRKTTRRRKNPFMSFARHGGREQAVTFYAHTTRQKKARTGTGKYKRGGRVLTGRKMGWRSSSPLSVRHAMIGRPKGKVLTKAQQTAAQKAAWKKLPKKQKDVIVARLRRAAAARRK